MGSLLTLKETFAWDDLNFDRNKSIFALNDAILAARNEKDIIFRISELFSPGWNCVFEVLWSSENTGYEKFKKLFSWISPDAYNTLMMMPGFLGSPTPRASSNWQSFSGERALDNPRSMIGFEDADVVKPLVFDEVSWKEFHSSYVTTFTFQQRSDQFEYFKKFYKPALALSVAAINQTIKRGQVNSLIDRIDDPPVDAGKPAHMQKLHVHIAGKHPCALNIDGSWKHEDRSYIMTKDVKEILSTWGFLLPDDLY